MASEFLQVAYEVLSRTQASLSAREIVDLAIRDGHFSDKRAGRTPHQTMKSKLSVSIRKLGESSPFVRTAPGRFTVRERLSPGSVPYEAPPATPPKPAESVLLFPTAWLSAQGRFQGIKTKGVRQFLQRLFDANVLDYRPRREAETLDDYKQIITYVIVARGESVLAFRRGNYNRAEDFLKGAECIGFGGHVASADASLFGQSDYGILEAASRELAEELVLPRRDLDRLERREGLRIIGLLNDDASANGRRHFAIVLRYDVSGDPAWIKPQRNEKAITQLRWLDPSASPKGLFLFEYWSQLCLTEFYRSAQITRPSFVVHRRRSLRPPHVLLVLGELGSGKSATARLLSRHFSYQSVNSGAALAELLGMRPLRDENGRAEFQQRARDFILASDGAPRLADELARRVNELHGGRILIEGVRHHRTIDALRSRIQDRPVGIIFVHTPFNVAFDFYRKRSSSTVSIEDFMRARNDDVEAEAGGLVRLADAVLYNWVGEKYYHQMVQEFMSSVGVSQ